MSSTSMSAAKKPSNDDIRIGEHSALQPVSGVALVKDTSAVNGMGHGAYIRQDESDKKKA